MGKFIGTEDQKKDPGLMLMAFFACTMESDIEGMDLFNGIIKEQWGYNMKNLDDIDMFVKFVHEWDKAGSTVDYIMESVTKKANG